ncbi:hypothetical protein OG497_38100 [Streptomyces sp. NBC_01242]|uniref:hypothetical protein n=1 Tax=Streptomyces sp. NBC_01242 TaxID=2903795 RepID=UPI0022543933|nr:hypothetical protein [Streptomyces sp. NBC_01242]MCX4799673.1 hypothetical protein [Streptomyces sp. NBC_01242]
MTRIIEHDTDSVLVGIVPQDCANCGQRTDRVRLALDVVMSSSTDFLGIRTVATTPCCGGQRSAPYPAEKLAGLLDHLQNCSNH